MTPRSLLGLLALGLLTAPSIGRAADDSAGVAFFESRIRPVLVEQCYSCHAADTKQRGGLRVDTREALLKGGDRGPALVAGKPQESLLVRALRHLDPKMPPKSKLSDTVVADFEKWIQMGAPDPRDGTKTAAAPKIDFAKARQFWSFQLIRRPTPPAVRDAAWARTAIDRFLLHRLEAEGLRPVGPASRRDLIRRVTFDLTGLPPTPNEVAAFEGDNAADAWEKVIDRLLDSPHYGERWGRHWLDVARYAEDQAHTFGVKPNSSAFRYRDWVFAALNNDMPLDRFLKYQLAADLLIEKEAERIAHLPALGFIGLGAQFYKDNTEIVKALADELDERVDTVSRGLLGLTVACARCHDHKFDPVPTLDYFALAGVFHSSKLVDLPLAPQAEVQQYQATLQLAREAEKKLKDYLQSLRTPLAERRVGQTARYLIAVRAFHEKRVKDAKWTARDQAKADQLDAAALDRWVKYLDGRAAVMVEALKAWRELPPPGNPAASEPAVRAAAESFQHQVQVLLTLRSQGQTTKEGTTLLAALFGDKGVFTPSDDEVKARLTPEQKTTHAALEQRLAELRKEAPDRIEAKFAIAHGVGEGKPEDMKVHIRGNPRNLGETAPRHFLRILAGDAPPRFTAGSGRRELADAIASPDNPLTARVLANRVWHWHFGRGIVGTPSNFGELGERPTHPGLLDYLAGRLIDSGWSLKALHREILRSAVYQLSSAPDERNLSIDGDNRLLWRMNRRRLDVESWRDAVLFVAGSLDRGFGGPTLDLNAANNRRRTAYAKVSRHELNSLLRLFDFPDANITAEKRTETTVPQQQLFVLNSPFIVEQAKQFSARLQAESTDDAVRIRRAFAHAFGREATSEEVEVAVRYLADSDPAEEKAGNRLSRWDRFAQVLLASNEFLYID